MASVCCVESPAATHLVSSPPDPVTSVHTPQAATAFFCSLTVEEVFMRGVIVGASVQG